jgi:hypothetical protein
MPKTLSSIVQTAKLELPVDDDHTYFISKVTGRNWLRLQDVLTAATPDDGDDDSETAVRAAAERQASAMSTVEMYRLCLGDQFDVIADTHDADVLATCATTAYFWQIGNGIAADLYWSTGGKAQAPTTAPHEPTLSDGTGDAATTTNAPASTSGTRNPPRKRAAKKTASAGRKSSSTAKR